jgi:hypothetical protein
MCDRHLEDAGLLLLGRTDAGASSVSSSQETVYTSLQEEALAAIHTIALAAASVAPVPLPVRVCVCVCVCVCVHMSIHIYVYICVRVCMRL